MSEPHRLMIAGAGAGKTTFLVNKLLETNEYSLITTFTIKNAEEIKKKIREINGGAIPCNIEVLTWDSFLIKHGIKPFLRCFSEKRVKGLLWVKCQADGAPRMIKSNAIEYYMNSSGMLYSDKLANLTCKCDEKSNGMVIDRMTRCYNHIFIDEAQDLVGYDFEFVKKLLVQNKTHVVLACDPRQTTYHTHFEIKNKKYNDGRIDLYIKENCPEKSCIIDKTTLNQSFRCCEEICNFSSQLYENEYPYVESMASYESTGHDGVFLVRADDVGAYLGNYEGVLQLRESRRTKVNERYPVLNMGESKGTTCDRVLIYPTADMLKWIENHSTQLQPTTKAKLYVAITRARYSVAIVCNKDKVYKEELPNIKKWI